MGTGYGFRNEPLMGMVAVGAVGPDWVRIWIRAKYPGTLFIRWWPRGEERRFGQTRLVVPRMNDRDNTCSARIPPEGPGHGGLRPMSPYDFRVIHGSDGHLVGEGRFETTPKEPSQYPSRFSIALMSCNQPFKKDGAIEKKSVQMLRAARQCMKAHNTKLVFMVGDQMYADFPKSLSLFDPDFFASVAPPGRKRIQDCTPAEVRRLYQRRYRHFWNLPDWQAVNADFPCYMILDDHDIVDNWGSVPAHKYPEWHSVGLGARQACFDYQVSRVLPIRDDLPENFHYSVSYGPSATFVLDIRSERKAGKGGRLFSDAQEQDFRHFLHEHRLKQILFIVLSVPVIHLPRFATSLAARLPPPNEDFSDRWSSGAHVRDRDRFLKILHHHQRQNPTQRVVLLSGDIHIGCVHELRWEGNELPLYQFISSGITHSPGILIQVASSLFIRLNRSFATVDGSLRGSVRLLKGSDGCRRNPYPRLNLGLVEVETNGPEGRPKMRFLLYGHRGEQPVCAYRSPFI